jgi:hypothetical protein
MSEQADHERVDLVAEDRGFQAADVLGVLAVSTFLAAIGLITFFVTGAFGA